jgi:hypothetical protein
MYSDRRVTPFISKGRAAFLLSMIATSGPALGFLVLMPISFTLLVIRNMKELRVQHSGKPYRVLFAFDPRRCAILLIGGDKTGNDRWYEEFVPIADALYDRHLEALKKEEK